MSSYAFEYEIQLLENELKTIIFMHIMKLLLQ